MSNPKIEVIQPTAETIRYCRLPRKGERCQFSGLSREALSNLIYPREVNNHKPPVESKSIALVKGQTRTTRLIDYRSLMEFIDGHD